MPLNDMQIRCVKPEAKAYKLGHGKGLSLLVEPYRSKGCCYRYAGNLKLSHLGSTQRSRLQMLVPVVVMPEKWCRK